MSKLIKNRYFPVVIVVFFIILILLLISINPKTIQELDRLKVVYSTIQQYPNSKQSDLHYGRKMTNATITGYYYTSASSNDITNYFDDELKRRGWAFVEISESSSFKEIKYQKDEDMLFLTIPKDLSSGWKYAFFLKWGGDY